MLQQQVDEPHLRGRERQDDGRKLVVAADSEEGLPSPQQRGSMVAPRAGLRADFSS
jgi:hypothetical protein